MCEHVCRYICLGMKRRQDTHTYTQGGGDEETGRNGRRGRQEDTHTETHMVRERKGEGKWRERQTNMHRQREE